MYFNNDANLFILYNNLNPQTKGVTAGLNDCSNIIISDKGSSENGPIEHENCRLWQIQTGVPETASICDKLLSILLPPFGHNVLTPRPSETTSKSVPEFTLDQGKIMLHHLTLIHSGTCQGHRTKQLHLFIGMNDHITPI